jgi:hypothetical protein
MIDLRLYRIHLAGQVADSDIAAFSPPGTTIEPAGEAGSILTVRTDQSGLVGLLRHLHGLGFVLLAFNSL